MNSKTFSYNSRLLIQNFKQHGWIGIVYFLGFFFTAPLQLLMRISEEEFVFHYSEDILREMDGQFLFLFTIPIFAGVFIFRYLHVKEAADITHSFPIKRGVLYSHNVISGLLLLLVPFWLIGIITWVICSVNPKLHLVSNSELIYWISTITVITIFLFVFTSLIGMITGGSVVQGILTYILLFLPVGLLSLVSYHLSIHLFGYSEAFYTDQIERLSPFTRLFGYPYDAIAIFEILIYAGLSLVLFAITYTLYKFRHIETATDAISFSSLKPIFKYGVTFCSMLMMGAYFSSIQNHQLGWVIFGYIVGAVIGYLVGEIVLRKTWRVFQLSILKGLTGYGIAIALLMTVIHFDVLGFETKIPPVEKIKEVHFADNLGHVIYHPYTDYQFIDDKEFIEAVHQLHEAIINNRDINTSNYYYNPIDITYKLNNGTKMSRRYMVDSSLLTEELRKIVNIEEYKNNIFQLDKLKSQVTRISLYSYSPGNKRHDLYIQTPVEIEEFKEAYIQDIQNLEYYANDYNTNRMGHISFSLHSNDNEPDTIDSDWLTDFTHVEQWLDEKGYLSQIMLQPQDILSMEVATLSSTPEYQMFSEEVFTSGLNPTIKEIKNEAEIKEILATVTDYGNAIYYVKFITKEGDIIYGGFDSDNIPAFLE
ncbi:DUF6449 domain-containing protein [Alkalihalobacterium alkalicellulosilyticum]|uniref:DUF6449 domain-containing protein n=1 Tax=Alkalihalobacterium alkalicellulosilyticum TaxID=1912214 RepID=UPI0009972F4F|nr:DUF6449 domain-containing protein [Bacillus alkalicellulosilyticus]